EYARSLTVTVERMVLTCVTVQGADQRDEAFLCPVWAIVYSNDQDLQNYVVLVNALDGSRVPLF
ncbi:MAG: hypothetical protein Q4C04_08710, partial [Clostridia bacterium]|nr:hypothetical protein [Clostridia bacterium]